MLLWFLFSKVIIIEPEDKCEIYLVDMNIAKFYPDWELAYDSVPQGFRTSHGCLDLIKWYAFYEAKLIFPLYKNFGARYFYKRIDDYGINYYQHRIEPYLRFKNLWLFLEAVPYFYKYNDEAGIGIGYIKNWLNYIEFFFILKDFDRNFASRFTEEGEELMLYSQVPFRFEIKARKVSERIRLKLNHTFTTLGKRVYKNPINYITERFDSIWSSTTVEFSPFRNIWIGVLFNCRREQRVFNQFTPEKKIKYDTLFSYYLEPFLSLENKKNKVIFEYTLLPKNHLTDTSSYIRNWRGINIKYRRDISSIFKFWVGYQRSWRKRIYNGEEVEDKRKKQSRLIFSIEFTFKNGTRLILHEGIEMDGSIEYRLKHPHNHTYILLSSPIRSF